MKAVGYKKAGGIDQQEALLDIEIELPVAEGYDLLVEVKAISVNPVDYKIRQNRSSENGEWQIIGWDASGIVKTVGDKVTGLPRGTHEDRQPTVDHFQDPQGH